MNYPDIQPGYVKDILKLQDEPAPLPGSLPHFHSTLDYQRGRISIRPLFILNSYSTMIYKGIK